MSFAFTINLHLNIIIIILILNTHAITVFNKDGGRLYLPLGLADSLYAGII